MSEGYEGIDLSTALRRLNESAARIHTLSQQVEEARGYIRAVIAFVDERERQRRADLPEQGLRDLARHTLDRLNEGER